ncbi:MAG: EAL domain-containing protein [Gallionellaceae bacterium]|nr:EAL domain-containing protein [Gallionellaceae bacterium]
MNTGSEPVAAYRWVAAIALLGLLLTTLAYQYSQGREQSRIQAHFDLLTNDRVLRLQGTLDQTLNILTSLRGLFDASEDVTRNEFSVMAAPILERNPDIMALNWAPKIMGSERQAVEQGLRDAGYAARGLYDVSPKALDPHSAANRALYFPVLYSEPEARNRQAIGLDTYARPENRAAMEAAIRYGKQWSTPPFALVQDPKGPLAIAVYQPVFRHSRPLTTADERAAALRGFVILLLRPGVLMENTLGKLTPGGLDVQLLDSDGGVIQHHISRRPAPGIRAGEWLKRDYPLIMPGHVWTLRVSVTEDFHEHTDSNEALTVLFSGLLLTTLISLFLGLMTRQSNRQAALSGNLEESETRFRQLAENIDAVFWISSPDWRRVLYISPAYERIWGYSSENLYSGDMDWFDAVIEQDRAALRSRIPGDERSDWQTIEFPPYRIRRSDGEIRWISARAFPIRDKAGKLLRVAGIAEDTTEQHAYQQHLEDLAHYDPLTRLPNRRLLADRMHQALAHGHRTGHLLALCMLDLDGFKPVNDTFGHKVGDQLLISVAQRLQDSVRGDDTVARLGGDEFVLLLGGLNNLKEVDEALSRLLAVLALPYDLAEQPINISASIGVTLYPSDASDADTLLRHADHAMYLAKQAGKNRYFLFNPTLEQRERDNRAALEQIEKAITENQLTLFYQPIVDCRVGKVVGMEALLRWNHPLLGLMSPAEFLPLVESNDELARHVGTWVLRQALRQVNEWHQAGQGTPVSINVFVQQLRDPNFPEQLRNLLADYPDLPAGRLTIEILESSALDDFASVIRLIHIGAELGVHFALDDFGTGFSSLTYLRRLPVNGLKIDQTFVRDMLQDPDDLAIVEGVIGLSTAFRHHVVAEGVESADHALMLMEMGCHLVQGYGIARPMSGDNTLEWLKHFQPDPRWLESASKRLARDDFQLVLAEVSHRQWLGGLQSWMRQNPGNRGAPPPLDGRQCNFGSWYYGEGGRRYGHLPEFRAAEARHEHIHQLAQALVQLAEQDDIAGSRRIESELLMAAEAFRDELGQIRNAVKYSDAGQ